MLNVGCLAIVGVLAAVGDPALQPPSGLVHRGVLAASNESCIPPVEAARIAQRVTANRARLERQNPVLMRGVGNSQACGPDQTYAFYPMGGNVDVDLQHHNFVDLDPNPGFDAIVDFNCTPWTYDGHGGIDTILRSFAEQEIGVPVFAALDGIVLDAHDGEPDMNTQALGQPSNHVILDHGFGREAWYFHLKNGSVTVNVGDVVRAGEQIGLAASSGNSTGPHLHFESRYLYDAYEAFAGPCRPGPSGYDLQPPLNAMTHLLDFGISTTDLSTVPNLPHPLPATGQMPLSQPLFWYWMVVANLPANSTWRAAFIRPNGTVSYDTGNFPMNINVALRTPWFWFGGWDIGEMHTIPGRWHVDVYFNDVLMAHAPVHVVAALDPNFNRAPLPISAHFDPVQPLNFDVIFCRVDSPGVIDDDDYDVVRYHYVWTVDGAVVRDIISAGQADAMARNAAPAGSTLMCNVTPSDGKVQGQLVSIAVTVGAPPPLTDFDDDGDVDLIDYAAFQSTFTGP